MDCIFQIQLVGYRRTSTIKRAILHINTIMEVHQEVSDNFVPVFYLLNAISRNKCTCLTLTCMSRSENTPVRKRALKAVFLFINKIVSLSVFYERIVNVRLGDYRNRNSETGLICPIPRLLLTLHVDFTPLASYQGQARWVD